MFDQGEEIVIHSNTKLRDILALNLWLGVRSRILWIMAVVAGVMWSLATVPVASEDQHISIFISLLIFGFGKGVGLFGVGASIVTVAIIIIQSLLVPGTFGVKIFQICNEDFIEDDGKKVTTVRWEVMKGVYKTSNHIFMQISAWRYFIIPKRDFPSNDEFIVFYTKILGLYLSH